MWNVGIVVTKDIVKRNVEPERDLKFGKRNIGFQKNQESIVNADKDDRALVSVLYVLLLSTIWCLNSSASQYLTGCRVWFSNYKNLSLSRIVTLGDDRDILLR